MLFNTFNFVVFFAIVYGLYIILTHRYQNYLLLAASYYFYSCWNWHFLFLLLFSTTMDYWFGRALGDARDDRLKKAILITSLTVNLGILFVFKYFNFFADNLAHLLGMQHFALGNRLLHIALPIGISFYTFHNISYIVDVYRGIVKPTRNFIDFALFVAYFPQLVAGPIARPAHLLPQMERERSIPYRMLRDGFWLILLGYYKKVVLADNMIPFTQPIFDSPGTAYGLPILFAIYAFALQIYGDFSGYTDIARGLAKLMGIELTVNFHHPYFATNPPDFWRRWHISLSTWLRDYLYIPLGGNRGGAWRTYRNLLLTMLLGGLWHGAAWHFVAWGAYHGALLMVYRACHTRVTAWIHRLGLPHAVLRFVAILFFFHITCFGWLLFAVKSLHDVPVLLSHLMHLGGSRGVVALATMLLFGAPLLLLEWAEERWDNPMLIKCWPRAVRFACYIAIVAAIVLCGAVQRHAFIYFQF